MDQKYFSQIKAREQAATPGPWMAFDDEIVYSHEQKYGLCYVPIASSIKSRECWFKHEDADFIAHARTDIPALLTEVENLNEQHQCDAHNLAAMQATLDQQAKNCEELLSDKDQQIATLKKALELACNDAADEQCPHEFDLYTCDKCAGCPHDGEIHTDAGRDAQCWYDYYVQQAKEQEGKK